MKMNYTEGEHAKMGRSETHSRMKPGRLKEKKAQHKPMQYGSHNMGDKNAY